MWQDCIAAYIIVILFREDNIKNRSLQNCFFVSVEKSSQKRVVRVSSGGSKHLETIKALGRNVARLHRCINYCSFV